MTLRFLKTDGVCIRWLMACPCLYLLKISSFSQAFIFAFLSYPPLFHALSDALFHALSEKIEKSTYLSCASVT